MILPEAGSIYMPSVQVIAIIMSLHVGRGSYVDNDCLTLNVKSVKCEQSISTKMFNWV